MKIRNIIIPVLLSSLILCLLLSPSLAALKKNQEEKGQEAKPVFIPPEVKSVLEEGMPNRQVRSDIPFIFIKHLYLPEFPSKQNIHSIFFFKVKNADLGFSPITPVSERPEEKKEKEKEKTLSIFESAPSKLQAKFPIFLQFNKLENNVPGEVVQEVYVPVILQEESLSYKPDKEEIYSTGYPLPPGDYLLSMAITSQNLKKIGTQYLEFSLPDEASFTDRLETTPIFFVKNMKRMDSREMKPLAHKGLFTYSILNIEPNIEGIFSSGEYLELFLYIFAAEEIVFDLELINWNWSPTEDGSQVEAKGQVKNISNRSLQNVEAIITFNDKEGKLITSSSALIDFNPILAGQTSPFKVTETYNPAIQSANINFKFLNGETIPLYQQQQPKHNIEIDYEVRKGDEIIIRFAQGTYNTPFISQPLPLKKTVIIKPEAGERVESEDLEPGKYTLSMKITDKVSGKSVNKSIDFEIK